jgi:hypothetical protein
VRLRAEDLHPRAVGERLRRDRAALLLATRHVAARELGAAPAQMPRGERVGRAQELLGRAGKDQRATRLARARPQLEQVIRAADQRRVVLDHHHRVAARREVPHQAEKPPAVARMKTDGGLVEGVERPGEPRAEGSRELDALRLAARERATGAVEGEVVETHLVQHLEPAPERVEQVIAARPLGVAPPLLGEPAPQLLDRHREQRRQRTAAQRDAQRLGLQPRAATARARVVSAVAREQHPHVDAVRARLEPGEELRQPEKAAVAAPHPLAHVGRQVAPRHVERHAALPARLPERRVVLFVRRRVPGRERTLAQRLAMVGHDALPVDADDAPEAAALGARAEG